ncbi:tryptophan synthase subunit alpha [Alteromonas pelagimontana]|uniref:Tryptophan synthase alpha chain n=1 Tax=Alteromonas pelagimontana TaxID=1858656 RepID=A0A6M4M9C3_9ALTE|nr:tryptophan synthase subunit alpha [Alteromonas pelagimontana]QJR79763.1 tryptophan synthase subunit alpha [Alteromonas pelagimontana]
MNRYDTMFTRLEADNAGAFVPFVMIGDPDIEISEAIICQLIDSGADALELGIPYSDPIADGPTIQAAAIRALDNHVTTGKCFALLTRVREKYPDTPIGLLLYSNLVMAKGIEQFYTDAAAAGVDSILIADVPFREAKPFLDAADKTAICQILIAPPNATAETLKQIGDYSKGYTYLLGRAGVTGAETAADIPAASLLSKLKDVNCAPPLLGFGISSPAQVKNAIGAGAAGAISGSATVNIIAANLADKEKMLTELGNFVSNMKAATHKD